MFTPIGQARYMGATDQLYMATQKALADSKPCTHEIKQPTILWCPCSYILQPAASLFIAT